VLGLSIASSVVSEQTFHRWEKVYSGMESDPVRERKQLQDENGKLKRLVGSGGKTS
jgi:hypothetical protein